MIANVCLLTSADNRAISDKAPDDYLKDVPSSHKESILASAFVPKACQDGAMLYSDFLEARANSLVEAAEMLISNGALNQR